MKPQIKRFCQLIAAGRHTNLAAAVEAGYSRKTAGAQASKLLRNVKNAAYIRELQDQSAARVGVTADFIKGELLALHEKCSQGVEVLDKEGNSTGVWKLDSNGSAKALDMLNKMGGNYEKNNLQKAAKVTIETKF